MAECSGNFSSNEKEDYTGRPKNLKKMSKLFVNMKLNDGTKLKKMESSELVVEFPKISHEESKGKQFNVAGKIISFLEKISVILVKPLHSEIELLNIGTNLYYRTEDAWIVVGHIDEIFGNIKDPMYAVGLFSTENQVFQVDNDVYFLADDSTTSLFHLECNNSSKYNVVYHN
ncbi:uncharacterized protein LOC122512587 [Leptopilina heterotoma]|uniref:uncharacterized protein LOC122512587 n=1 Tax=Leptopilina heterotoma TaxID=63436 RepID=UPI001CA8D7E2|nr:uncharacterized protein LOC122512587 [Leptopilina heterotoma]